MLNKNNIFCKINGQLERAPIHDANEDGAWFLALTETLLFIIENAYDAHDQVSIIIPDESEITIVEHEESKEESEPETEEQPLRFIITEQNEINKTRKEGVLAQFKNDLHKALEKVVNSFQKHTGKNGKTLSAITSQMKMASHT